MGRAGLLYGGKRGEREFLRQMRFDMGDRTLQFVKKRSIALFLQGVASKGTRAPRERGIPPRGRGHYGRWRIVPLCSMGGVGLPVSTMGTKGVSLIDFSSGVMPCISSKRTLFKRNAETN